MSAKKWKLGYWNIESEEKIRLSELVSKDCSYFRMPWIDQVAEAVELSSHGFVSCVFYINKQYSRLAEIPGDTKVYPMEPQDGV